MEIRTDSPDWVEQLLPLVRSIARQEARNASMAEDLTQQVFETFLSATELPATINSGYVEQAIKWRLAKRYSRKLDRLTDQEPENGFEVLERSGAINADLAVFADPEQSLQDSELSEDVSAALQRLPDELRRIIVLSMEEKTNEEICAELGISKTTRFRRLKEAHMASKFPQRETWHGLSALSEPQEDCRRLP